MKARAKLFLLDGHPITRGGLAELLNRQPDMVVCGEAGSVAEALRGIKYTRPDMVVVELSFRNASGLELIKDLQAQFPYVSVLVLTMLRDVDIAVRALRAGARGVVFKEESTDNVLAAIRSVLAGDRYLNATVAGHLAGMIAGDTTRTFFDQLSDREREVFELLSHGRETADIAAALHIAVTTVQTYMVRLKEKLGLRSERELLVAAVEYRIRRDPI